MIKELNGKKYIFVSNYKADCHKCVADRNNELCESLGESFGECYGGYFSEVDDQTPEVTVTNQEQPTLRDQFAMAIITGKIYCFRSDTQDEQDDYAQRVYALADSIMKARAK